MRPAVWVVASHLQAYAEDGIHAQDVGGVQPDPLQLPDLLQFLLHFQFHCARKTFINVMVQEGARKGDRKDEKERMGCCARAKRKQQMSLDVTGSKLLNSRSLGFSV